METVIKEGMLRLQTTETSCDVILNCQGQRLMAHKVILSIASPILRDLLLLNNAEPTVLILPDVNSNTMSLILDYIYTGSVIVYSNLIQEFLSVANLLKLQLDQEFLAKNGQKDGFGGPEDDFQMENFNIKLKKLEDMVKEQSERLEVVSPNSPEVYSKKNQRKLPDLLPLQQNNNKIMRNSRNMCNSVIPSPWKPRLAPVLADPRKDYPFLTEGHTGHQNQMYKYQQHEKNQNDANNNFKCLSTAMMPTTSFFQHNFPNIYYSPHLNEKEHFPILRTNQNKRLLPRKYVKSTSQNVSSPLSSPHILHPEDKYCSSDSNKSQNNFHFATNLTKSHIQSNTTVEEEEEELGALSDDAAQSDVSSGEALEKDQDGDDNESNGDLDLEKNDRNKPYKCEDCTKTFSQLRNYKYHRSVHEGTKEFAAKCPECGKVFNDRGYLSSHMKIHRDRKEYACPHCPKRFNQRVAYNMHLRIHTGVKPHECITCGKSFSRKMLLKQHLRVHTGERPYSCPECGKTFADRSNMSLHARLHTGVKPYACTLCPKSFTKKHHLKTHMNFHTGLKPYTCEICGLAFSQSSNMRTHYKKCILKKNPLVNNNNNNTSTLSGNSENPQNIPS